MSIMEKDSERFKHCHIYSPDKQNAEKLTLIVVLITLAMMFVEIAYGWLTNSMALLADGWHMGTHAFALGISLFAYIFARKQSKNCDFAFGTWKIEILGAYSSALLLGLVAIAMVYASVMKLLHPAPILYDEAILVAVIGLVVNAVCAFILGRSGVHDHDHGDHDSHADHDNHDDHKNHDHHESGKSEDLNMKSAYMHVLADALTSILAIAALLAAKYLDIVWLDPVIGIVGAVMIARWSIHLLKSSASVLLDYDPDQSLTEEIRKIVESDRDSRICDLHIWKVSDGKYSCIVSVVTSNTKKRSVGYYKKKLSSIHELSHITVEINDCG